MRASCRYEARLNPFANVNPHQVDIVLGENVVYHLADVLAHHLIQAYGYRSKDIADNLKAGVDAPQRSRQATAEESVGSSKTPWRQLRRGLSVEMTRRLLGEPHETSESRASTIWYFPDVDGGFVAFRNGLVVQWREPVAPPTKPVEEIATTTPATEQPKRHIDKPPTNAVSPELYRVISTEDRPPHWCRYSVRLEKRLSEEELGWIAQKLKRSQGHRYNKTLVFFLLPGMQDAGYWARALFEPDLKIRITGMTAEQEKQALEEPADASRDSLGRWLNEQPFASSVVEIYRQDGKLIVEHKYKAGFSLTDELIERTVAGQTRYDVRNNSFGEYYVIDSSGNLGICDRDGLITTAGRIR